MNAKHFSELLYTAPGKAQNLNKKVLEALVDGDQLTTLTALQKFRTIELRTIISRLRRAGVPISDRWATSPNTGKRFKVYYILNQEYERI